VSAPDFLFALDLPKTIGAGRTARGPAKEANDGDASANATLVNELAAGVLKQAGFAPEAIAEIAAAVQGAVATACAGAPICHVRFHAHAGELVIAVSGDGADQTITRRLPQ
jgi:hypothetical protein